MVATTPSLAIDINQRRPRESSFGLTNIKATPRREVRMTPPIRYRFQRYFNR